ncbi:hypothetical protein J4401_04785 [Candidatus Woesearchaeota archaeon]|nr:hypothetical protein [Candidatus Woesearchaeota archaeon]
MSNTTLVKIVNCIEPFYNGAKDWDSPEETIERFLAFAKDSTVEGMMDFSVLRHGEWSLGEPLLKEGLLDFIRDKSGDAGVLWVGDSGLGKEAPKRAYITSSNDSARDIMAKYFAARAEALFHIRGNAPNGIAVVDSPMRRNLLNLSSVDLDMGLGYFADTIARAIKYAPDAGVIYTPKILTRRNLFEGATDIVYTTEQAVAVVNESIYKLGNFYSEKPLLRVMGRLLTKVYEFFSGNHHQERVNASVNSSAAYWSEPSETVEQAFNQIPEGLRSYLFHVQSPVGGPPGHNNRGEFKGDGFYDMSRDVGFIVGLARQGHPVQICADTSPEYFNKRGIRTTEERLKQIGNGNNYLKELLETVK